MQWSIPAPFLNYAIFSMFTFYGLPIALNSQVLNIIMDYYGFVLHKSTITCVDNGIFDEMYSDHTSSGICLLFIIKQKFWI